MTTMMKDVFKLFAQFPQKEGVLAAFNKGTSDVNGYANLKTEIENLSEHTLIPAIKNFVFGVDEDAIREHITRFDSYYLFIDYGNIDSNVDNYNRREGSMYLAATVAIPINRGNYDMADQVLLTDETLGYLMQIRQKLIDSQKKHPWLKNLSDNHEISPFVARELNGSIGWTMTFRKEGYDFVK